MTSGRGKGAVEVDSDRYPTATKALQRIVQEGALPDGPVEWLEVQALASGELTYRWRLPRADDDDGGYLPPPS